MRKILFIHNGIILQVGLGQLLEKNLPFDFLFHMVSDDVESIKQDQYNLIIIGSVKTDVSELVKKIKVQDSQTRILIFSDMTYADAMNVLIAGADGFIDQNAAIEEIVLAVRNLIDGKGYWGRKLMENIAQKTINDHIQRFGKKLVTDRELKGHKLSKRQLDVVRALIQGESIPMIAASLGLSPSTVSTHKSIAFKKLGINSLVQLVDGFYSDTNYLNQQTSF